jgi:hypothetical protein
VAQVYHFSEFGADLWYLPWVPADQSCDSRYEGVDAKVSMWPNIR